MKKRIGFGIVGLGQISGTHAAAFQGQESCYLVGGFHKSREKAEQWASMHNCRPFYSLEEMLADPEIDAVSVTTPSGAHLDPALAAISAGTLGFIMAWLLALAGLPEVEKQQPPDEQ